VSDRIALSFIAAATLLVVAMFTTIVTMGRTAPRSFEPYTGPSGVVVTDPFLLANQPQEVER